MTGDLIAHCRGQHGVQIDGRRMVTGLPRQLSQSQPGPACFCPLYRMHYRLACLGLFRPDRAFVCTSDVSRLAGIVDLPGVTDWQS